MNKTDLNLLRSQWSVDDRACIGRVIYDAVPSSHRPDWAGAILSYAAEQEFLCDELSRVIDLSYSDTKWVWMDAHDAFSAVRKLTLRNEKMGRIDSQQQMIFDIAETAAKVIYNASDGPAPFDYHAGWRLVPCASVAIPTFDSCAWA